MFWVDTITCEFSFFGGKLEGVGDDEIVFWGNNSIFPKVVGFVPVKTLPLETL